MVLPYINMNLPRVHVFPILNHPPTFSPYHPSGSSQCTSPKHPISCIKPGLAIRFLRDIINVSMPFSEIIPPSPSPTESIRLFYTSVSLLLFCIQGYRYHLSFPYICVSSLVAQRLKCLPGMWETLVRSLGQEDPLEKEMATHSTTLARRIPWREEPGRLQSMGSQRVGHDRATSLSLSLSYCIGVFLSGLLHSV